MGEKNSTAGRQPVLLTLQQAAAETGVPYTSVRKLVLDGTCRASNWATAGGRG